MSRGLAQSRQLVATVLMFVVIGLSLPFLSGFHLQVVTDLLIVFIIVSSFRFIATMGRWSFAHMALAGVGGFTSAILTTEYGWSFWVTLGLGGLSASAVALVISVPTMRTSGFYFFMSTFAAGALIVWAFSSFIVPFGGTSGLYGVAPPGPVSLLGLELRPGSPVGYGYVVAVTALVSMTILLRLEQTRLGAILKAIRWQPSLALSLGLNVRKYETLAFVIGSFFAGIAGVLFVHYHRIAYFNDFGTFKGINIVMFTVVGGAESFFGPPVGAALMTAIEQGIQANPALVPWTPLVFGSLTLAIVLAFPAGVVAVPGRVLLEIDKIRGKKA
jgi:branched-chain amino acid transport system permease protein